MALKYYKHIKTGEIKRTLKDHPGEDYEEIIKAPNGKFMVCANPATGTSKIKDLEKTLKARARNHSRDTEIHDTIELNKSNDFGVKQNLLNEKGLVRKKIDDI